MRPYSFDRLVPILTIIVCAAVVSVPAAAESMREPPPPISARALRGGGEWHRTVQGRDAVQPWDLDVTQTPEGAVSGRVVLRGSPLAETASVSGMIEGRRVAGNVCDEAGNHVATFVGKITPNGAWQGTYQDRTGEVGRWSWSGLSR